MNDDRLRSAFDDLLDDLPPDRGLPATTARRVARRRSAKQAGGALCGLAAVAGAAVLVVGLTGSGGDQLVPADEPAPDVTSTVPATPSPEPTGSPVVPPGPTTAPSATTDPSATATPSAPPSDAPAAPVRVVLRPDGLGFTDGGSSSSSLAFGTDGATVRAAVDRALGEGGATPTPDCGQDVVTVQYETLFLLLDDDVFVGWVTGSPGPTTGDGIGVGSTLADLRASFPDLQVSETTLGVEWTTPGDGGLSGFLEGTEQTSLVSSVRGGTACLAR